MAYLFLCILLITAKDVSTSSFAAQGESLPSDVTPSTLNNGSAEAVLESVSPTAPATKVTSPQTPLAVNKSMENPVGLENLPSTESPSVTPIFESPLPNKDAKNNSATATPTIRLGENISSTEMPRSQNGSLSTETSNTTTFPLTTTSTFSTSKPDTTTNRQTPTTTTENVSASSPSTENLEPITNSPTFAAKRCCKPNYILTDSECENSPMPVKFDPFPNATWETKMLECKEGYKLKAMSLDGEMSPELDEASSMLEWKEANFNKRTSEYCIGQHKTSYSALICEADLETLCSNATCMRKCCGMGEVLSLKTCKPSDKVMNLTFSTLSGDEIPPPEDLFLVPQTPKCEHTSTFSFSKAKMYSLLATGKLYLKKSGKILDNTHFCVEHFKEISDDFVAYCVTPRSAVQEWKVYLLPIGMVISIVFLSIIVLFHLLNRHLRNVQGLCFLAYSTSLLMSYIGFFNSRMYAKQMSLSHCVFNGLFKQFCLLSSFFWLSVMCFDIWRVIRATVKCIPLTGILEKDAQKFLLYSAYAFGCPLIISLVTLIMQTLPVEYTEGMVVPGFGEESCWFASEMSQFLYFYLGIATINATSLLMLGHVMFMLCDAEKGICCLFKKRSAPRAFNRKHLSLFRQRLSLFVVMAVCWFTEVLSLKIPPKDIWVVTDILNTFQGVIVFIIFMVSKKKRQLARTGIVDGASMITSVFTDKKIFKRESSVESTDTSRTTESSKELDVITREGQRPPVNTEPDRVLVQEDALDEQLGKEGIVNEAFQHQEDD